MNRKHLQHLLSAFAILIAIVACVLPQAAQPPLDPNALGTAVAGTVEAAAQQTAAVQPLPTGRTGTTIEQLEDGTTKYADYDAGFEITFPVGWLAVRPNSEEFNASLSNAASANSMLHEQMTADQAGYEANYDRLYSYILRPDLQNNVLFGFSKLVWDSDDTAAIDSVTMGKLVQDLESSGAIPGFRVDTAQLHEDSSVKKMEIGGRWMMSDGQGGTIPFYSTFIFFKPSPNSGIRITFSFLEDYHIQISADMKSIIDSIRVLEP